MIGSLTTSTQGIAEEGMQLRFIYPNSEGVESERTLIKWNENSWYINGRSADDSLPKTYRKDRIVEFLQGEELLLGDAAPPAPEPAPKAPSDQRPQIQFTGFSQAEKAELQALADAHGLWVMSKAGKHLAFLCCGPKPAGPRKIADAHDAGATIMDSAAFRHLLATGEILDTVD